MLLLPFQWPSRLATSPSPPIGYHWWPPMLPLPLLPSAISDGHQCYLSLPSNLLSVMATNATSHSPPIGYACWPPMTTPSPPISYQCWPPMLPLTPLPLTINDGHQYYLSLHSHQLAMLATNATSHSPPISYHCWPPLLPLTPLPSAINAGYQCYLSLAVSADHHCYLSPTQETYGCNEHVFSIFELMPTICIRILEELLGLAQIQCLSVWKN